MRNRFLSDILLFVFIRQIRKFQLFLFLVWCLVVLGFAFIFLGVFVVYGNIVQKSVYNEENIVLLCKASVENPIADL